MTHAPTPLPAHARPPAPPEAAPAILLVEDEDKVADVLQQYLQLQGLACHRLRRGDEVCDWVRRQPPDLILLDRMLPGQDGLLVCQALRAQGCAAAVLMVTARADEADRLAGLTGGADDYICKPFSPREVVARVQAHLRRQHRLGPAPATPPPHLTGSAPGGLPDSPRHRPPALVLDAPRHRATLDGHPLTLTALEFQLLGVLAGQPGRVFRRAQLMDAMYPDARDVSDRTVDSHIRKLRRKLAGQNPGRELIHAIYGMGYTWDPAR